MKKNFLLFILTILYSVSSLAQNYSDYTKCAEQDSLALVAFYWATGGPNWTSEKTENFSTDFLSDDVLTYYTVDYPNAGLGRWLEGPVKNWFGVTLAKRAVGNTTDSVWRVIHLHPTLSRRSAGENNLVGYVPKEVGLLTALEWFKVNGNTGLKNTELPDELYHSTILALDFEGAFFSGVLSSALRNCTNLKYPNFRDNYFDSIPVMDFITDPWASLWVYRNQISWATLEPTVAYLVEKGYGFEARDQKNVGRESEIVVTPGSSITLTCNEAGENGTCTWYKKGINTFQTGKTYTINNVSAGDTGNYTVVVANEYIRLNDENADYVNTFTKPIHVTFEPSTPYVKNINTDYSGNTISIEFSKPMDIPLLTQTSEFDIKQNGAAIAVTNIKRTGRLSNILELYLEESIVKDAAVTLSYNPGTLVDVNGGAVKTITNKTVANRVRGAVNLVSAITSTEGDKIILEFDKYIDPATLSTSDFTISGTNTYTLDELTMVAGTINSNISKKIALVTAESMGKDDEINVSYTRGSLNALYGAAVQSFENFAVVNIITENKVPVFLKVHDGSKNLNQVVVFGDMKSKPFRLYDDGTNGDDVPNDNIWTIELGLTDGDYNWVVYNRLTTITYDTTETVDPETGVITYILSPVEIFNDSIISGESNLNLSVSFSNNQVLGDTVFKYRTNTLTLILDMLSYLENNPQTVAEPYLMGINGDWVGGILMNKVGSTGSTYSTTVIGFNAGNEISYNFKNGDVWENTSAEPRKHTIVGNDTVEAEFGNYVSVPESFSVNDKQVIVYPNPIVNGNLWFNTNEIAQNISIYNLTGQKVIDLQLPTQPLHINSLKPGVYLIKVIGISGNSYQNKFVKK
jgi:uncharacterized repeat protein (TIGR02059 family)